MSGLSLSQRENVEKEEEDEFEEKIYVAIGKEFMEWKENLRWVLKNTNPNHKIVFVHVHQPSPKIPTPLGNFAVDRVRPQELRAYRLVEKEDMNKALKPYLDSCKLNKFSAIAETIDNSDISRGLLELIKMHKITNLIMGAASDRHHSRTKKDKVPRSRTAIYVQQNAEPFCRISFVCKGELICIKELGQNIPNTNNLSRSSSSSSSSNNSINLTHSQSLPPIQAQQILAPSPLNHRSASVNVVSSYSYRGGLESEYAQSNSASSNHNSTVCVSPSTSPYNSTMTLKAMESTLKTEMQKRFEMEENFRKQTNELENYKAILDQTTEELNKSNDQRISLELQIRQLEGKILTLQTKSDETNSLVYRVQEERDETTRDSQESMNQKYEHGPSSQSLANCSNFSLLELKEATHNFDKSNKIGEGGYGGVYKGSLRHIPVAIKVLCRDNMRGDEQFYQEVEILSRVRHPHLVTLIGACLEIHALVYEFMPLMSLDEHLTYKNRRLPLPWQARVRIAREICSALIFLHSNTPQCIVHGDLKPENVLLDSNYVCKLGDFGICRQLNHTNTTFTPYHLTEHPKGTLPYMDPEYLSSGELTPHYDVFSFGIVILQLATGREARNIRNVVVEAIEQGRLGQVVDREAGNWPPELAKKMVHLGLWCSEPTRRKRPDLVRGVLRVIESMVNVVPSDLMKRSLSEPAKSFGSTSRGGGSVPTLFICPLSKEIMMDPQIATDGYTYEAKSIKDWFDQGHNASPITNKKMESFNLVPNITFRSAIQDWLH